MHMSKIFNFLSSSTYSSLGVDFFCSPFGLERGGKGNPQEQPQTLKAILQKLQYAMDFVDEPQTSGSRTTHLDEMHHCYTWLQPYEADEEVRKIRTILREVLKGYRYEHVKPYNQNDDKATKDRKMLERAGERSRQKAELLEILRKKLNE